MATTAPLRILSVLSILLLRLTVDALHTPNDQTTLNTRSPRALARRSATVDLQRNPNYTPNGPAAYARALQKWGAEVPAQLTQSLAATGDGDGVGEVGAETVRDDREYLSRVGLGTPPQWLSVDLDTGSADVWVYTSDTRASVAQDRRVFKLNESSTAQKVENATWMISYGDGSTAYGTIYHDTLLLANITLPNATLESALSASSSLTLDPYIDGILGLPFNLTSQTTPQQPTVLSSLLPLLASPVFTADLRYHSSSGAYTFGYVDAGRYKLNTPVWYTPLVEGARFWEFGYSGFRVGGEDRWFLNGGFRAIADTGTTLMLLSREIVEVYYQAVPGAERDWSVGGIWTFPCDLTAAAAAGNGTGDGGNGAGDAASDGGDGSGEGTATSMGGGGEGKLPDFQVGFANGFVATVPGKFINYTAMPDDPSRCMGGLQEWGYSDADLGIFGDVFLKAVYAVFDVGGARIGFAEKDLELD